MLVSPPAALLPTSVAAAELDGASLGIVWALPFAALLLSIAIFPILALHFWERHQAKIVAFWAALIVVPLALSQGLAPAAQAIIATALHEYIPFVLLLLALFTTAGGIVIRGNLHGSPMMNVGLIAAGGALASVIGTTGASMVMIRPLLRANDDRRHNVHTVIFFIFIVANIGGSLTPLGDPPLFLGFLRGVSFFWPTTHLLLPMLLTLAVVLAIFFVLDRSLYRREGRMPPDPTPDSAIRVSGLRNMVLIGVIIAAILLSATVDLGEVSIAGVSVGIVSLLRDAVMIAVTLASLRLTPAEDHAANGFAWGPIREVAVLFAGIFVTLIPVLAMLRAGFDGVFAPLLDLLLGPDGTPNNLAFFWLTGLLSSFLDNAPTYIVFFELAGGDPQHLMTAGATTLAAISAGAVFMGANSYIGNAPNFMVYAIARDAGVAMPSFFGYMKWSGLVLLPTFVLVSLVFFL